MKAILYATFKNCPADFIVTEQLPFADLTGTGEHLWLYLQKTGINTQYLAELLAKWANIPLKHVGFSGLKDRHATTLQWVSLYVSNHRPDLASFADFFQENLQTGESVTLLKHSYHQKKLNRGTHKANHFKIVLRDSQINLTKFETAMAHLAKAGFPNFFGNQRFGRDGNNLEKAHRLCAKAIQYQGKFKTRASDGLIISTARSHIFNEILACRVADGSWQTGVDGDVFNLAGTGSLFDSPMDDEILHRLQTGDIHATAPLFGKGGKQASGQALAIEQQIINRPDIRPLADGLLILSIGQRRALRAIPNNLTYHLDGNALTLEFELPTGSFATSLLEFVVEELVDKSL